METLSVAVDAQASPERVFAVLTDWPRQHEWMLLTRAWVVAGDGRSRGSRLAAATGVGPLSFVDTMDVTGWRPPHEVEVRHTGRVVRGVGRFHVLPRPGGGSRIVWEENLHVPLGLVGRIGWRVAGPVSAVFLRVSLRRLAALALRA